MTVTEIPLRKINLGLNSRVVYTDLGKMMASMEHKGLLQPVGVRPGKTKGTFDLLFGYRRYHAAKKLGWKSIPCYATAQFKEHHALVLNLTENIHRRDPSLSEQGKLISQLKNEGLSPQEIATMINLPAGQVKKILHSYHELPENIKRDIVVSNPKFRKNTLSLRAADVITGIANKNNLNKKQTIDLFGQVKGNPNVSALSLHKSAGRLARGRKNITVKSLIRDANKTHFITVRIPVDRVKFARYKAGLKNKNPTDIFVKFLKRHKELCIRA